MAVNLAAPTGFEPARASPIAGHHLLILLAILLLAIAVRTYGLDFSLWYDEVAAKQFSEVPLAALWSDWILIETNPPLYYSLLKYWTLLFGEADATLRMLSVVTGVSGVGLIFLLGRALFDARTGLTAAALTCLSAQNVMFSQQVRAYILTYVATLLVLLATLAVRKAVISGGYARQFAAWAFFVLSNLLALYSHTTMVLLPLLANIWLFFVLAPNSAARTRYLAQAAIANLALLALWAWWARISVIQTQLPRTNISWIVRPSVPYAVRMTMESWLPWQIGLARFAAAASAAAAVVFAFVRRPHAASLPMTIVVGAPLVLFVLSLHTPVFLSRTIFWASGPFLLLVAAGLCAIPSPRWRALAIAAAVIISAWNFASWWPGRQTEPWRQLVRQVEAMNPSARIFTVGRGAAMSLEHYCPPASCKLDIVSIRSNEDERWTRGFPVRHEVDKAEAERLLRESGDAVVVNWLNMRPELVLRQAGREARELEVPGLTPEMSVAIWKASDR